MLPTPLDALKELEIGGQLNPGPWTDHALNTGLAAKYIAEKCEGLDPEKAYILGMLHDIGRRAGIASIADHVYEGYQYAKSKGWDEVAHICMTHSYMIKEKEFYGEIKTPEEQFIRTYIQDCTYDDYDRLIQLCDSLAIPNGFCLLEKRFVDTARRYGFWETTLDRWNKLFDIKAYFDQQVGGSIYDLLPNIKETSFVDLPTFQLATSSKAQS